MNYSHARPHVASTHNLLSIGVNHRKEGIEQYVDGNKDQGLADQLSCNRFGRRLEIADGNTIVDTTAEDGSVMVEACQ